MAANSDLDVKITGTNELSPALKGIESDVIRFVGAISAALAGIKIAATPIINAANLEYELANVAKTTNFTGQQMDQLNDKLLNLSLTMNLTAVDLAKIASAAGQQGLGREGVAGIVQFTESVGRMSQVLNVSAEKAATDIGKILNIFKIPVASVEQAISTIAKVSITSTASGKDLLDVIKRIGDANGTLNLKQATALAATGLDLGVSPEVVGTQFTKLFQSMFSKADQFARLMKTSTSEWVKTVRADGIGALKDVLDALRNLSDVDQQKAIVKLTGQSRGALTQKLIQDSSNQILDKELANADIGTKGTTAIQEQLRKQDTLVAQVGILQNSFVKLQDDAAKPLLNSLTTTVAQLSAALQTTSVKLFVKSLAEAFGQLVDTVTSVIKTVADLNINWENFVVLAKVYAEIKLGQKILEFATGMGLLGGNLKSVAKDTAVAAASTKALNDELSKPPPQASKLSKFFGYEELSIAHQKRMAELAAEDEANLKVRQARVNSTVAQAGTTIPTQNVSAANAALALANNKATAASGDVLFQESAIATAQAKSDEAIAANHAKFDQRRIASAEYTAAQLTRIENEYQNQVNAIDERQFLARKAQQDAQTRLDEARAAGTTRNTGTSALTQAPVDAPQRGANGRFISRFAPLEQTVAEAKAEVAAVEAGYASEVAAAQASRDRLIAQQKSYQEIAIANIQASFTQRLAALESAGAAEVAAEKVILQEKIALLEQYKLAQAAASANASRASASLGVANAIAVEAKKVEALQVAAVASTSGALAKIGAAASETLAGFGLALRTVGSVAAVVGNLILKSFFWLTLIVQVADFLHLLDTMPAVLQKVTDYLGFTSAAQRQLKVEAENTTNEIKRQRGELELLTATLTRFSNASGLVDQKKVAESVKNAASPDPGVQQSSLKDLVGVIGGVDAKVKSLTNATPEQAKRDLDEQLKIFADAQKQLTKLKKDGDDARSTIDKRGTQSEEGSTASSQLATIEGAAAKAAEKLEAARVKIEDLKNGLPAFAVVAKNTQESAASAVLGIAKAITPDSEQIIRDYVLPLKKAQEEVGKATTNAPKQGQEAKPLGINSETVIEVNLPKVAALTEQAQKLQKALDDRLAKLQSSQGELGNRQSQAILGIAQGTAQQVEATLSAVDKLDKKLLDGSGSVAVKPPTTGDGQFLTKADDAKARQLATAQRALALAQERAIAKQADEDRKVEQAALDDSYKHGLVSIEDYYAKKQQIQLAGYDADVLAKRREVEAARIDVGQQGTDPAAQVNALAKQKTLEGELQVLLKQRPDIMRKVMTENADASKAFQEQVLSDTNKLVAEGILPSSVLEAFDKNYEELASKNKVVLEKLTIEGKTDLANALRDSFNVQAFTSSIVRPLADIDLAYQNLGRTEARLQLARTAGDITTQEYNQKRYDAVQAEIPLLETQLKVMTDQLQLLKDEGSIGGESYKKLAANIDDVTLRLQTLKVQEEETSRQINQNFTDSLTKALDNFQGSFKSLKNVVLQFLLDITNNLKHTLGEEISQTISKAIKDGIGGDGQGIGGILSDLIKRGSKSLFGVDFGGGSATATAFGNKTGLDQNALQGQGLNTEAAGFNAAKDTGLITSATSGATDAATKAATDTASTAATSAALQSIVAPAGEVAGAMTLLSTPTGDTAAAMLAAGSSVSDLFLPAIISIVGPAAEAAAALAAVAASSAASSTTSAIGTAATVAAVAHTGGIVGGNVLAGRSVSPAVFGGATRYHTGGIAGLQPNEVPAILQRGETVLTARQAEAQQAALAQKQGGDVSIRSVIVTDPSYIHDAMSSSQGERVLLQTLTKNKASLKQLVNS